MGNLPAPGQFRLIDCDIILAASADRILTYIDNVSIRQERGTSDIVIYSHIGRDRILIAILHDFYDPRFVQRIVDLKQGIAIPYAEYPVRTKIFRQNNIFRTKNIRQFLIIIALSAGYERKNHHGYQQITDSSHYQHLPDDPIIPYCSSFVNTGTDSKWFSQKKDHIQGTFFCEKNLFSLSQELPTKIRT